MGKLYVAYGSNLNLKQMAYRCPSASIYSTGQLTNWELLYRGSATNSHATIAKSMVHMFLFYYGILNQKTRKDQIYMKDIPDIIISRM